MTHRPEILVAGSNRANLDLLSQQLGKEGYATQTAASLEEIDKAIREKGDIVLSLIDLSGFDQRIWERCEQLRKSKIPFIVVSPMRSPSVQRDSMRCGAGALLVKPIGVRDLMEFVHTMLGD